MYDGKKNTNHYPVHLKLTQYCKSSIPSMKKKEKKMCVWPVKKEVKEIQGLPFE